MAEHSILDMLSRTGGMEFLGGKSVSAATAVGAEIKVRVRFGGRATTVSGTVHRIDRKRLSDPLSPNQWWFREVYIVDVPGLPIYLDGWAEEFGPSSVNITRRDRVEYDLTEWLRSVGLMDDSPPSEEDGSDGQYD